MSKVSLFKGAVRAISSVTKPTAVDPFNLNVTLKENGKDVEYRWSTFAEGHLKVNPEIPPASPSKSIFASAFNALATVARNYVGSALSVEPGSTIPALHYYGTEGGMVVPPTLATTAAENPPTPAKPVEPLRDLEYPILEKTAARTALGRHNPADFVHDNPGEQAASFSTRAGARRGSASSRLAQYNLVTGFGGVATSKASSEIVLITETAKDAKPAEASHPTTKVTVDKTEAEKFREVVAIRQQQLQLSRQ